VVEIILPQRRNLTRTASSFLKETNGIAPGKTWPLRFRKKQNAS
jgi:hypothetical protein